MDISSRLQALADIIASAKSMPLSSSAIVNREELLTIIDRMREEIPEEIRQARWIVKDRDEVLTKARRDAESLIAAAREEQTRLASREEVVRAAHDQARRIAEEATEQARRLRLQAEDYAEGRLAQFEVALQRISEELVRANGALSRTIGHVQVGRDRLRAPLGGDVEEPEPAPPPLVPDGLDDDEA